MCSSSPQPAGWAADRHGAAAPHSTARGWALLLGTLRSAQPRSPEAHLRSDRSDKGIKAILIQQSANNNTASIYILCHDFHPKLLQHSLHSTNASPVRSFSKGPGSEPGGASLQPPPSKGCGLHPSSPGAVQQTQLCSGGPKQAMTSLCFKHSPQNRLAMSF